MIAALCIALIASSCASVDAQTDEFSTVSGFTEEPAMDTYGSCSYTNKLLGTLIAQMENVRFQLLIDLQLKLSTLSEKVDAVTSSVAEINSKSEETLKSISTEVEKVSTRTQQISDDLRIHDQRLQNFTAKDFCKSPQVVDTTSTVRPTPAPTTQAVAPTTTPITTAAATTAAISRDCSDIKKTGAIVNGVYRIYLTNGTAINVYCDFTTSSDAWLVFQRRKDGSISFNQTWNRYQYGFGSLTGEFYLGNEILHLLTYYGRKYKLRIDLEDFEGQKRYAEYSSFSISSYGTGDFYRLRIGLYSGDAGDSLINHNNTQFSTPDCDRDASTNNCAALYTSGWWFTNCYYSNLNSRYWPTSNSNGNLAVVVWSTWRGWYYSLKGTEMKIALVN